MKIKRRYLLISVEIWNVDAESNHHIVARRETEIDLPRVVQMSKATDTAQRASANMVESLKDYLTFRHN